MFIYYDNDNTEITFNNLPLYWQCVGYATTIVGDKYKPNKMNINMVGVTDIQFDGNFNNLDKMIRYLTCKFRKLKVNKSISEFQIIIYTFKNSNTKNKK